MLHKPSLSLRCFALLLTLAAGSSAFGNEPATKTRPYDPARWEKAIAGFEAQDRQAPFAPGGVVFVGSSSIRLWKLDQSFPELRALNRGFGGSEVADSVHFADQLVIKHKPAVVVMYAGDNDLKNGKTPERVAADFGTFVARVHKALPETRIVYLAVKPSLARWNLIDDVRATNALIESQCDADKRLVFADIAQPMLGDDGRPRPELFAKDGLHLSDKGYELWTRIVTPHVRPGL